MAAVVGVVVGDVVDVVFGVGVAVAVRVVGVVALLRCRCLQLAGAITTCHYSANTWLLHRFVAPCLSVHIHLTHVLPDLRSKQFLDRTWGKALRDEDNT